MSGLMDRLHANKGESKAYPTARGAISTWTRCGERLLPRRANEGYTAEPSAYARLVCQAYHRHPGRMAPHAPCASTRSLRMPAEPDHLPIAVRERGLPVSSVASSSTQVPVDEHETVCHAARRSQGVSLTLASASCRGCNRTGLGESTTPAGAFAPHRSTGAGAVRSLDLSRELCVSALCRFKGRPVIAGVVEPHRVENAHPDIRQGSQRHTMTLALFALALVISQCPGFLLGRLPCKLLERVAQRFDTGIALMRLGVVSTFIGNGRSTGQGLHTARIAVALAIIAPFGQQGRCRTFSRP